jgi:hypothetical protein
MHGARSRFQTRLRRLAVLAYLLIAAGLALAPVASAHNDGRGFYGATDDKVITDAGFILIIFFPTFVFLMSMLQRRLEKRKDARKAAQGLHADRWRGGW